ncbi:transporter [Pontibacter sp. Tf4]|uniref:transporter n=1 Tax=Pontibacter sp. Tf4 TaxID=2761620 RepID=UPI001629F4EC|nr:transporter [Pontibacter sp. Tf4]MBB6610792.1 transporter [Pontibacter sp. Tf4]
MQPVFTQTIVLKVLLLSLVALLLISSDGFGQNRDAKPEQPPLETDRPDQADAAAIVPARTLQLETGLYFEKDRAENTTLHYTAYPTALLRAGILDWLELRVEATYQQLNIEADQEQRLKEKGFGPLTVGTKIKLWEEQGLRPQAAFMTMVDLPVGDKTFSPENPEPHLRLLLKNSLTDKLDLNYNLAYGWQDGDPLKSYAVSLGAALSDKVTVYGEVFGEKQKGEKASHSADAGILFLISPTLQVDAGAGIALNKYAPDYFVTTGVSIRVPR